MLNHKLKRRLFLRGLGGAAVAAPFLSSVVERAVKAQGEAAPAAPKRLIVMFTHYGCLTDRWFPENSHGALSAADYEGTSIEALAPHADKILVPRGIRAMNEWMLDVSLGQGNDMYTQVVGSYFTCVPVKPHTNNPFEYGAATKFRAMPTAPSLDHVCAQQLSADGLPLVFRVGDAEETPQSAVSYSADSTYFPGIGNLTDALAQITGLFQSGAPITPDAYQVARGKSLLDLVRDDLDTLERFDMSQSDKQKLADWKDLLSETNAAITTSQCTEEVMSALGLTTANIEANSGQAEIDISAKITDNLDSADLFSNVAVLSAICDQNRVIFLKYPPHNTYQSLGFDQLFVGISQRTGTVTSGGTCLPDVNEAIMTMDRFHAEKFAHLISQLDHFDEGGATLLDNSATVWFQEFSDGCAGNLNNMPIVQAGSCGGTFKTGQAVNLHDGSSDLHRGNSSLLCQDGGELEFSAHKDAGTPVDIGNAPINKYYCNLMNAIGVKAGADGFPAVGGTQDVTHYGLFDRTEDFRDGGIVDGVVGAAEPNITDPGEFSDLRANS